MVNAKLEGYGFFAGNRIGSNMDVKVMQQLINSVKENEGYRSMVYKDS